MARRSFNDNVSKKVEAAKLLGKGPEFSRAVVEIGILGGVVLVLSMSAFILRARRLGPDSS